MRLPPTAILITFLFGLTACSGNGATASSASTAPTTVTSAVGGGTTVSPTETAAGDEGRTVSVSEREFAISLDSQQASAGRLTFQIHNDGLRDHNFIVFQTDLPDYQLPTTITGLTVEEDKLDRAGEQNHIAPGADASLTLTLEPGHYVLICDVTGHYINGMHTELTVG